MQIPSDAVALRIFFGEDDKFRHQPLHEAIVMKAREMHLGGATVVRGHAGFGHSSRLHTASAWRLSQDLPVVVEIVDSQEKIEAFLPILDTMMSKGLVTMERVRVLQYGPGSAYTGQKMSDSADQCHFGPIYPRLDYFPAQN